MSRIRNNMLHSSHLQLNNTNEAVTFNCVTLTSSDINLQLHVWFFDFEINIIVIIIYQQQLGDLYQKQISCWTVVDGPNLPMKIRPITDLM